LSTVPNQASLRFALICSGDSLPAASAKYVEELLSIKGVELALIIITPALEPGVLSRENSDRFLFKNLLWRVYARSLISRHLSCFEPVDMARVFAAVPKIGSEPLLSEQNRYLFSSNDIDLIRAYKLDFILQSGGANIGGEILNAAKYGVWSFYYSDIGKPHAGPAGFWEIYFDEPITGAVLLRLTDKPRRHIVLQKCFIQTQAYSHAANLNAIMWAPSYMPELVCRDILNGRTDYLDTLPTDDINCSSSNLPNNLAMLRVFCKTSSTWVKRQLQSTLFCEDWNVGIVREPIQTFLDADFRPQVNWLATRKADTYVADPFVLEIGRLRLLAEEFNWNINRGYIVEIDLRDGKSGICSKKVLDEGVHMSYPYLLEHEGRYYCMPETSQKRCVSLYVFDSDREVWSPAATIIRDFPAVDSTPVQFAGRWWIFCTSAEDPEECKLFIWHSPDLFGPWEPHIGNPVKMDVRSSRPAGRPFFSRGELFRPAQDCSITYGGAITINRVTRLTVREFSEEPAAHVPPIETSPYKIGIHTVTGTDGITVLDGKRWVLAPRFIWYHIRHKLKKLVSRDI
jgi:hypothetical protein